MTRCLDLEPPEKNVANMGEAPTSTLPLEFEPGYNGYRAKVGKHRITWFPPDPGAKHQ